MALYLGHRRSVDFDLATRKTLRRLALRDTIRKEQRIESVLIDSPNEQTLIVDGVKLTFLKYPFPISFTENLGRVIKSPSLVTLAAMKAYTLGRRAKWKDYVDLYFVFQKASFVEVVTKAKELFKGEFNERLFREQLVYFEDIDYSETIDYLPGFESAEESVRQFLKEISLRKT